MHTADTPANPSMFSLRDWLDLKVYQDVAAGRPVSAVTATAYESVYGTAQYKQSITQARADAGLDTAVPHTTTTNT